MSEHDLDDAMMAGHEPGDEFSENVEHLGGAGEAIAAKHLEERRRKAVALAKKYEGSGASFLSREWFKSLKPAPIQHVKKNWMSMLLSTASGAGLAAAGGVALSSGVDLITVTKTGALSYPAWKILNGGGARLGFLYGHVLNATNRDRFREVKTEPAGRWAGRAAFVGAAFVGGVLGNTYLEVAKDLTYKLPATITAGVPSFVVDTFTNQSNTKWDAVWERDDQLSCLGLQAANPEHICKSGPGSEFINFTTGNDSTYSITITDKDGFEASKSDYDYWDAAWDGTKKALGIGSPHL